MSAQLCAFDLETTGLSPRSDQIIEIGAVRFGDDGRVDDRLELLVDPGMALPVAIQRLTGLRDEDLAGGLTPLEAVAVLADFAEGTELVAHGAAFDLAHCAAVLPAAFSGRRCHDTLELARIVLPAVGSHSLPRLAVALGVEHTRPHRALPDAEATRGLLLRLIEGSAALPAATLAMLRSVCAPLRSPLRRFFLELVEGDGDHDRPAIRGAPATLRRHQRQRGAAAAEPGGARPGLAASTAAALGPGGALDLAVADFELREPQVEMARAVAQTLERGGRLLVEAGTGTGKSVAYLAPLLLDIERTGRRAVVATHTLTLQEQLAERELPRLLDVLDIDAATAMLKGRSQYLSLRRWQRLLDEVAALGAAADPEAVRFCLKVLCWLAETVTGDRTELRLSGNEEQWWRRVMSDNGDCLGSACANWRSRGCYMVAARQRAAEADLVVVNHALLVADSERQGQVLGAYSTLVVDEAQELEEAATRQLGTTLRAAELEALLIPARLAAGEDSELALLAQLAREAVQRLFGDVKGHIGQRLGVEQPGNASVSLGGADGGPSLEAVLRSGRHCAHALRAAAEALVAEASTGAGGAAAAALAEERALVADELAGAAASIERILDVDRERGGNPANAAAEVLLPTVSWLELRAEQAALREAPTRVDTALAAVFDAVDAAVLTSATLSVAGSFGFVRGRTGLGAGAATLSLPSPFDYLSQALTVLPQGMPPYDVEGYDAALADLVVDVATRLEGRTLVLFTGYAPLRACHGRLTQRLEGRRIAVLGQGLDGTRRQVLESFLAGPRSVLLGTSSFWEGVDLPGDALRCVVIAKLPFPVPTDPLVQARGALVGDPFRELLLPIAVLRLKQGFGRLIRRGDDRGAVVLCDERIKARDYGATFLRALPEARAVRVPLGDTGRVVEAFVRSGEAPAGARVPRSPGDESDDDWEPA